MVPGASIRHFVTQTYAAGRVNSQTPSSAALLHAAKLSRSGVSSGFAGTGAIHLNLKGLIMLDASKEKVSQIMESKNWTELMSTAECQRLMKANRDICEQSIKYLDQNGYIDERMAFPKWCLNKYRLYEFLKKHKRVSRCAHAEKILKSEKKGK
jgi:hypothetical protein